MSDVQHIASTMEDGRQIAFDILGWLTITIFVGLKLWVSFFLRRRNGRMMANDLGDGFIVLAYMCLTSIIILDVWLMSQRMAAKKQGEPMVPGINMPADRAEIYLQITYYYVLAYITLLWAAKGSMLCNYHLVSSRMNGLRSVLINVCLYSTALSYPISLFSYLFWCRPMSRYWSLEADSCIVYSMLDLVLLYTTMHLVTDIIVMLTGLAVIRSLQLGKAESIATVFVFFLGTLTVATGAVRFAVQLDLIKNTERGNSHAMAGNITTIYSAGLAEVVGAMVSVCLPALRVFLRRRTQSKSNDEGQFDQTPLGSRDRITVTTYVSIESNHSLNRGVTPNEAKRESQGTELRKLDNVHW